MKNNQTSEHKMQHLVKRGYAPTFYDGKLAFLRDDKRGCFLVFDDNLDTRLELDLYGRTIDEVEIKW